MSKFSKKVSSKLDAAADATLNAAYEAAGPSGEKVANVLCAVILGRYWKACPADCGCRNGKPH